MKPITPTALLAAAILTAGTYWQPLAAQSRQQQVANEAARSTAGAVKACPLPTIAEGSEYADSWTKRDLEEGPLDLGSTCDYGGFVTVRVFAGDDPEAELDWLLENYHVDAEERQPIDGFGSGAFLMYPEPQSEYQDEAGVLVGRAGARLFMVSFIPQEGQTLQSVRPHLEALSRIVLQRLQ